MPATAASIGGLLVVYLAALLIIGILQTVATVLLIMSIVKSVKSNKALKLDPENTELAAKAKKAKTGIIVWSIVLFVCAVLVGVAYGIYMFALMGMTGI